MGKVVKNLATILIMGVPVWVVLVGLIQFEPASLVVHVEEPGVRVWVGSQWFDAGTHVVGPVELKPGEYPLRVTRGGLTLFSDPVVLEPGHQKEVWAHWKPREATASETGALPVLGGAGRRLEGHWSSVTAVGFSGDGRRAVSVGMDRSLRVWDAATGRAERTVDAHDGPVTGLTVLADGRHVLTAGDDAVVRVWDLETGEETRAVATGEGSAFRCAAASSDGRFVAFGTEGGVVRIWDMKEGRERHHRKVSPATPASLAFSPDGRTLLVGLLGAPHGVHPVGVWDVATGEVTGTFRGHRAPVWGLAFLPDGRRAVSASSDRTLRIWDVTTGKELNRLENHPGVVFCVAVSADGRRALAGTGHRWDDGWKAADDYGVQIWDLQDGRALGRLETSGPVRCVAVSADGRRALAGGDDRVIRSWDLPLGS